MKIVADLSLYPLKGGAVPEIVSNQLSTQLRGEFDAVTGAVQQCMRRAMTASNTVVLVVKYLNVDLEIGRAPTLTPPDAIA